MLIDNKDPRIERDIGDAHQRTPHFVQCSTDLEGGDESGVLYWPTSEGRALDWCAKAFWHPTDAIEFLDMKFGKWRCDVAYDGENL